MTAPKMPAERERLAETHLGKKPWKRWGPYLSERQWGTVREDYSPAGTAWEYFPHDHARSRAYRWGEDGIAGFSDNQSRLCLSLALWNGKDPDSQRAPLRPDQREGNHGEDVKEIYYYLDATPTHSYLKMLYKYPQREFPYCRLVDESNRRKADACQPEFELLDTGIFDDDRYLDVFVEYAKAESEDILMRVTVHNRGPEEATIHLLPQLWFRNTWSWDNSESASAARRKRRHRQRPACDARTISSRLRRQTRIALLRQRHQRPPSLRTKRRPGFFKDAFHEYVVNGNKAAVNPQQTGTKCRSALHITVPAQGSREIRLRLVAQTSACQSASVPDGNENRNSDPQTDSATFDRLRLHIFPTPQRSRRILRRIAARHG